MSRVAVLKGGPSLEREVSLRSGTNVELALARLGHEVIPIEADQHLVRTLRDCLTPHLPMGLTLQIPTERARAPQKSASRAVLSH